MKIVFSLSLQCDLRRVSGLVDYQDRRAISFLVPLNGCENEIKTSAGVNATTFLSIGSEAPADADGEH